MDNSFLRNGSIGKTLWLSYAWVECLSIAPRHPCVPLGFRWGQQPLHLLPGWVYYWHVNGQDMPHAILVKGLQKTFGDQPVLWDLDLTVNWGEFLVIFGSNGVGKTTLLKVLSAQAKPDGGDVWIGGINRSQDPKAVRRMIGVVAHSGFFYEDMTCLENLVFYGRMYGLKKPHDRAEELLHLVGLGSNGHDKVRILSHGMQKRLAIARAILHEPVLLLLDEPEAGLDQGALGMLGSLLDGWRGAGRTVVMTTHNLEQGLAWGDRVAIMAKGRIAFEGDRQQLDVAGFRDTYKQYLEAIP